ncbi:MAG: PAS domain S-box protein [Chlorobiaceae bacterium]|nr:PAS domain S-box protein [Chlorobiaceae bacterium]
MPRKTFSPTPFDHEALKVTGSFAEPVILIDAKGAIIETNSKFADLFGKKPLELVGAIAWEAASSNICDPNVAGAWKEQVKEVLESRKQLIFEYEQDGKFLQVKIYPVISAEDTITRMFVVIDDITGKKSPAHSRHHELAFKEILEALPGFVFIMDAEGYLIGWNNYTKDVIIGPQEIELPDASAFAYLHPDDRNLVMRKFQAVIEFGTEQVVDARVQQYDCEDYLLLMVTGRKILIEGEACVLGIGIDMTERNLYENTLNAQKTRFSQALEAAHAGVWEWNINTGENIWSDEMWSFYDLERGDEKPSFDLWSKTLHPEDRESSIRSVSEAARNESELTLEYRVCMRDGSTRWLMARGKPVFDNLGHAASYIGTVIDITERKELSEQLRVSESKYRSLFENIPKGIAYCRMIYEKGVAPDFIFLDANAAFERITGFVDVIGKRISDLFPGIQKTHEKLFRIYEEVARTGKSNQLEYYVEPLNQWHSISVASPEKGYFIAIFDVITEQKNSEIEILKDKAKLEAALASMTDAVLFSDTEGRFIDFNEAFATFHRFKNKEECAKTFAEHPELLEVFMENGERASADQWPVSRALRGETATNAVYTLRRKDTGETWSGSYGFAPILDANGKIVGSVVTGRDVTEQKLTENALRESEFKFRSIFDHAPVAIGIGDIIQNRLFEVNSSWLRFFGYSRQEVIGRTLANLRLFSSIEDYKMLVRIFREEGRIVNRHVLLRKKSGEVMNIIFSAENITFAGRPSVLVMMMDITHRIRAEEEQEKLQAQLLQSQKMELIGQLAGGIAHDFNNVLAVILGNTELLLEQVAKSSPLVDYINDIHKSAIRSIDLTRQLLAFARKQTAQPIVLSMNSEVENLLPMLRRLIGESIRILWHPDSCDNFVRTDPSQLDQILTNLSVNARDAIKDSGTITIETGTVHIGQKECTDGHPCQSPGDYVRLSVTDSGSGIDKNTLPHIFEPFFTTKEIGKGTGLGLSTVYGIIKQNNGYLECRTEQGKGTTFSIYLPRHDEPKGIRAHEISAPTQQQTSDLTILLVEDEPQLLNLTRRVLENKGFTVLTALDADTAVSLAENHSNHIDLLVTDITLPKMNGVQLGNHIIANNKNMKVLYMSGYSVDTINHAESGEESNNFILKPFTIKDFLAAVYRSLNQPAVPPVEKRVK